jgi:hydrogenase maturation protease
MNEQREGRTLVLGVGNVLLGDEGVGIHAVRKLRQRSLPPHVDVVDGGTAGVDLLGLLDGYEKVVIIDAVDAGEQPGSIFRFTPEDIPTGDRGVALSLHQTEVLEILGLATYLGQDLPPVVIYAVQPEAMDWNTRLSARVEQQIEPLLDAIQREFSKTEDSTSG